MRKWVLTPVLLVPVATLVIIGCASIMHGTRETVVFESSPGGATVEVSDAMGVSYGTCETPCSIDLKRKREYKVKINKAGYAPVEMVIQRKSSGWIWGNILIGGVIGLIVDFTNGAAYKLSPTELHATLSKESVGHLPDGNQGDVLVIFDFDKLSLEEKDRLSKFEPIPWPTNHLTEF